MTETIKKWALIALFAGFAILSFLVIRPYILAIIFGAIIAFLIHPLYKKILAKTKKPKTTAILTLLSIIILILIPTIFAFNIIINESVSFYSETSKYISSEKMINLHETILEKTGLNIDFSELLKKSTDSVANFLISTLQTLPKQIINIVIIFIVAYYLLIYSENIKNSIKKYIPIHDEHKDKLLVILEDLTSGVVFGFFLTAVIQGVFATIGYYIFQVPNPLLLGFLTIFASLIPILGAGLIWGPVAIFMILKGTLFGEGTIYLFLGIGLLIYGSIMVSSLDNFIRPYLISGKTKIHPLIIILGIMGGITIFGFIGIFLGPIILTLFITLLKMHEHFLKT